MTPEEVHMLLERIVEESGLPKTALAKESDLSYAALNAWLTRTRRPKRASLRQLARGLRVHGKRLYDLADELDTAAETEGAGE